MPNWVHNHLVLKGPDARLAEVSARLADPAGAPLTFQSLLPRPASAEEDWWTFNTTTWGCKWDAAEVTRDQQPGQLEYRFETPWAPPTGFIEKFRETFDDLDWDYFFEEEQGWGGHVNVVAGEVVDHGHYDIPLSHADMDHRGIECSCLFRDEQVFDDCFAHRVNDEPGLDAVTREVARGLGPGWEGTFDELLAAARRL